MHGGETRRRNGMRMIMPQSPRPREAGVSLLRLSAGRRIAVALIAVVLIWCGVWWALS